MALPRSNQDAGVYFSYVSTSMPMSISKNLFPCLYLYTEMREDLTTCHFVLARSLYPLSLSIYIYIHIYIYNIF